MIYLDNAATTKPFKQVTDVINRFYDELYFNPSSLYAPAYAVADEIEKTREFMQTYLGGGGKVYFTSCATESNTWVYNSGIKNKKGNVVVSMGEHASGYENAQTLISKGYDVRFVKLLSDGRIDESDFEKKVDANTAFVSVIHCSNETGAINDIQHLANIAKSISEKVLFHSDGVQALGKIPVNCNACGIDFYSMSAHKIGGAKGTGALWVRDGIRLNPLLPGGGQEKGFRSGTENAAGIAGFGEALKIHSRVDYDRIAELRQIMKNGLTKIVGVTVNESKNQSPYILSLSIEGIKSEILQRKLAEKGVLIGLGSACSSKLKKNRILSAMNRTMSHIEGSIRISFGASNINDDIKAATETIKETIQQLRG